jgi:hypothetical protein
MASPDVLTLGTVRTIVINIRVSPREKAAMEARARRAGLSLSAYLRRVALGGAGGDGRKR